MAEEKQECAGDEGRPPVPPIDRRAGDDESPHAENHAGGAAAQRHHQERRNGIDRPADREIGGSPDQVNGEEGQQTIGTSEVTPKHSVEGYRWRRNLSTIFHRLQVPRAGIRLNCSKSPARGASSSILTA